MAAMIIDQADGLASFTGAEPPLAPVSGAFSVAMAARLAEWRCE